MSIPDISRRRFVSALPLTVLAAPSALSACGAEGKSGEEPQPILQSQGPGFIGPFSEAETAAVAASPLAQEIAGLNGNGYPCSEMILLAALRRFGLPENHLDAAAVFGGGVGKGDLCGLLTGGLMAVGFAAGEKHADRAEVHRVGREASNAYWDWWLTRGDLHCMGYGTAHETSEEFVRMCQRAAVKLEAVMTEVVGA
ncbi:MAG: C-GCAxxG-C-C family protein [Gemmatimonadota bacterium]